MLPRELVATPATSPYDGRLRMSAFASKLISGADWATNDAPNATAVAAITNRAMLCMDSLLSSAARGTHLLRVEEDLLRPPRRDFRGVDLVGVPAVQCVHGAEFLERVARLPEATEDLPIQLHLVNLAGQRRLIEVVAGRERVGRVEILMRSLRDAHGPGRTHVVVHGLLIQIVVEHDDPRVAAIGDVDHPFGVDGDPVRCAELQRAV